MTFVFAKWPVFMKVPKIFFASANYHKMVKNGLPDRWLNYEPLGQCIPGTQIIAFKVPLKSELCKRNLNNEAKWFTPTILLENQPNLKTVIDLTNTNRYYNAETEFGEKGVKHVKIMVEGHGTLPTPDQIRRFFKAMDAHMEKYADDKEALVGVHCTHGLNRTGYFVCKYLVDRLQMHPDEAIDKFNSARGHPMERQELINNLKGIIDLNHARNRPFQRPELPMGSTRGRKIHKALRRTYQKDTTNYISPLASAYDDYSNDYYNSSNSRSTRYDRGRYHQVSRADLDKNWRAREEDEVVGETSSAAKRRSFDGAGNPSNLADYNDRRTWEDRANNRESGRYRWTAKKFDGSQRIPNINRRGGPSRGRGNNHRHFDGNDF